MPAVDRKHGGLSSPEREDGDPGTLPRCFKRAKGLGGALWRVLAWRARCLSSIHRTTATMRTEVLPLSVYACLPWSSGEDSQSTSDYRQCPV